MKVFIGSSSEAESIVEEIEDWLETFGLEALPWTQVGLFKPGQNSYLRLREIAQTVEAAIFLFGEDDRVWYRDTMAAQPRDNVILEYGLFSGVLGPDRAIICRYGDPKSPTDLLGLTYVDIGGKRKAHAKRQLREWARDLEASPFNRESAEKDRIILELKAIISQKDRIIDQLREEVKFERDAKRELIERDSVHPELRMIDSQEVLFDFTFVMSSAIEIEKVFELPEDWRGLLMRCVPQVAGRISWTHLNNKGRNHIFIRKTLRLLRSMEFRSQIPIFLSALPPELRIKVQEFVSESMKRTQVK